MPSEGQEVSILRKGAATASMLGAAALVGYESIHISPFHVEWLGLAFAGILGVAGFAMTQKNLVLQTLARGSAWIMAFPALTILALRAYDGHFAGVEALGLALTTGAALLLSRPMLHTKEAKAAFNPAAFRRTFLAGSTATAATAFLTGGLALEMLGEREMIPSGIGFAALTLALLAVATAVVRMRAWGILLGAATSATVLGAAAVIGGGEGTALAMLSAPMLVLHLLPIFLARHRGTASAPAPSVRIAASSSDAEPAHYRIAMHEELEDEPSAPVLKASRATYV